MSEEVYQLEHGPRAGETIIFLHGGNVAGWMWDPQVQMLPDRHLLTPDLPGYGGRSKEVWPGMSAAADDVAQIIRERAINGKAHVVGLSMGGHIALHLIRNHPDLVISCTITGVASSGLGKLEKALISPQVPLWHKRWYWAAQAAVLPLPKGEKELYITACSGVLPETNQRMFQEVASGSMPKGPFGYKGPILAVKAEREQKSVQTAFKALKAELPQLKTWIAPKMHHIWNIENPELFTRMITTHIDTGKWTASN